MHVMITTLRRDTKASIIIIVNQLLVIMCLKF